MLHGFRPKHVIKLLKECKGAKKTNVVNFVRSNADFFEEQMLNAFIMSYKNDFINLIKESIFKEVNFYTKC